MLKDPRRHAPFLHGGTLLPPDYRYFLASFKTSTRPPASAPTYIRVLYPQPLETPDTQGVIAA